MQSGKLKENSVAHGDGNFSLGEPQRPAPRSLKSGSQHAVVETSASVVETAAGARGKRRCHRVPRHSGVHAGSVMAASLTSEA